MIARYRVEILQDPASGRFTIELFTPADATTPFHRSKSDRQTEKAAYAEAEALLFQFTGEKVDRVLLS